MPQPTNTPTLIPTATSLSLPTKETSCHCNNGCPCIVNHIVIISIDGLRPDALDLTDTPAIDALRAAGAYSSKAQTVLPSVTLISHASMLGGVTPEKHGITWNTYDPALGIVNGPTIFSIAHQAGLSTTMVVGKPKLEHLVLPDLVDTYHYAGFTDRQVGNKALQIIETGLPNILFIHLPTIDSAGHLTGWLSAGQLLALRSTDSLIGELVAALKAGKYLDKTLIIVTADHGGSDYNHGSNSPEDMTIPWLAVGPGIPAGLTLKSDIIIYDTAATALYALNLPIPEEWDGQPVKEIFEPLDE